MGFVVLLAERERERERERKRELGFTNGVELVVRKVKLEVSNIVFEREGGGQLQFTLATG
jgi:hypothetical protein